MPSIISAGTTTGSSLSLTGDTSGELQLQTNNGATTAMTLTTGGNINIPTLGARITGDFSNATVANRVAFQTSTTNSNTTLTVLPNGTGAGAFATFYQSSSDPANTSVGSVGLAGGAGVFRIENYVTGAGAYFPITFNTGGSERLRIDTSGNVGIGTSSPTEKFHVAGTSLFATTSIAPGAIEVGITGSGDRPALVDFHASGAPGALDFSARLIRNAGANGILALSNVGSGGLVLDSSTGNIALQAGGSEKLRVDSSGNVTQFVGSYFLGNGGGFGWGNLSSYVGGSSAVSYINFITAGVERARFNANGSLLINSTTAVDGALSDIKLQVNSSIAAKGILGRAGVNATGYSNPFNINWIGAAELWIDSVNVGTITVSSDYRIKRNIKTQTAPALERVMALRPVTYQMADFKDGLFKASDDIKEGFIAHEVQEVIPSGAEGVKDDETQIQSLRVDAILAVAVKAIQELKAELDSVKAELQTLKGN